MSEIVVHIKNILLSFNGSLLVKERELPDELKDLHEKIYSDEGIGTIHNDRENLQNDYKNVKSDVAVAVEKYREESSNG